MAFEVFDYRRDIRNLIVTPQIRSRFLKMEPGQYNQRHSHDLGYEMFLILQGKAEFEIEGHKEIVSEGQLCMTGPDEIHGVRNMLSDEPTIMYLSVTPHIAPTHTFWAEDHVEKKPPRFVHNSQYEVAKDMSIPIEKLIDDQIASLEQLKQVFEENTKSIGKELSLLKNEKDSINARKLRDDMSKQIHELYKELYSFGDFWNCLAPRIEQ